jgi:hypothetical protein
MPHDRAYTYKYKYRIVNARLQSHRTFSRILLPISHLTIEQGPQKSSWAVGAKLLIEAPAE